MKTIRFYLNQLPEPFRSQAIANANESELNALATDLNYAIYNAFLWRESNEGLEYWVNLKNDLQADQFADDHYEEQRFDAENLSQFED